MVVANQHDIRGTDSVVPLLRIENGLIGTESLIEILQIFTTTVVIVSFDLAHHHFQCVKLRGAAA